MGPVQAFYAVFIQAYDVVSVQANYAVSSQANHVQSGQAYYAVCLVYVSNINSLDDSKSSENLGSTDAPPDRYRIATATRPDTRRRAHSASPWAGIRALGISDVGGAPGPESSTTPLEPNEKVSRASEWDHILFDIMLETDVPAYEGLVKWCGLFPQYREKLASHFVWWALDNICCDEPQQLIPLTDEERYAPELDSPESGKVRLGNPASSWPIDAAVSGNVSGAFRSRGSRCRLPTSRTRAARRDQAPHHSNTWHMRSACCHLPRPPGKTRSDYSVRQRRRYLQDHGRRQTRTRQNYHTP